MRPMERTRYPRLVGAAVLAPLALGLLAAAPRDDDDPPRTFPIGEAAQERVAHALEVATEKNRRVLVVLGREDSAAHAALATSLRRARTADWPIYYEFEVTPVDYAANEIAQWLGVGEAPEGAHLVVLAADREILARQTFANPAEGARWSTDAIGEFLAPHVCEPIDAEELLADMTARAADEKRNLLVHLGAPW